MRCARWHTETKAKTLVFLREIGRNDLLGISDAMAEGEHEDDTHDWDVCVLECRICGHKHTGIVPHEMADTDNECANCGNMTADVIGME